jgi:hypothetical protein
VALSHTVFQESPTLLNHYYCQKLLFLGLCIFLIGGEMGLATTLDKPRADDDSAPSKNFSCLPKDVRADEVVSYDVEGKSSLTVKKKLIELKARCRSGKLVDAKGREIRFFRISCWGNPPEDYLEIQKREGEELAELKKHYSVIEFGCNPTIH